MMLTTAQTKTARHGQYEGRLLQRGKTRVKAVDGPEMPIEETGRLS